MLRKQYQSIPKFYSLTHYNPLASSLVLNQRAFSSRKKDCGYSTIEEDLQVRTTLKRKLAVVKQTEIQMGTRPQNRMTDYTEKFRGYKV